MSCAPCPRLPRNNAVLVFHWTRSNSLNMQLTFLISTCISCLDSSVKWLIPHKFPLFLWLGPDYIGATVVINFVPLKTVNKFNDDITTHIAIYFRICAAVSVLVSVFHMACVRLKSLPIQKYHSCKCFSPRYPSYQRWSS